MKPAFRHLLPCVLPAWLAGAPASAQPPIRLEAPRTYATCPVPSQALPMDLDDDGDLDLAVYCGTPLELSLQLLENAGDGTYTVNRTLPMASGAGPAVARLVAADLNADNRLDLVQAYGVGVTSGELLTLVRGAPFTFSQARAPLAFAPSLVCAGRLDTSAGADLVIGDAIVPHTVHVYVGDGAGGFTLLGSYDTELSLRDYDNDGDVDPQSDFSLVDCALGDLNGDALDDLVVSNSFYRGVSLNAHTVVRLPNQGNGVLGPFQVLLDPFGGDLALGDMDGDGDRDIVALATSISGPDMHDVVLLRNLGGGAFAPAVRYPSGVGPDGAGLPALADVDGDGDLDVGLVLRRSIAGNPNDEPTDRWVLLRNTGAGALGAPRLHLAGAHTLDFALVQLDGLHGPEALSVAGDDARVVVHYNQFASYFGPTLLELNHPGARIEGPTVLDMAAGDLDADGRHDLAVTAGTNTLLGDGPDTVFVVRGTGGGAFAAPVLVELPDGPMRVLAGPIAGSGASDLAVACIGDDLVGTPPAGGLALGVNGGLPGPLQTLVLGGTPFDLAATDFNGDGTRDLAFLRLRPEGLTAGISLVAVGPAGQLTAAGTVLIGSDDVMDFDVRMPFAVEAANLDGDARRDLVAVTQNVFGTRAALVRTLRNNPNGTFSVLGELASVEREVTDALGADVDGDGLDDVVLASAASLTDADPNGSVEVLRNTGGGQLAPGTGYPVGVGTRRVAAAQLDGLPGLDLVAVSDGSNEVTVLYNDGTGGFPVQESYLAGDADALAVTDLDGDGDADVAVANDLHMSHPSVLDHRASVSLLLNRATLGTDTDGDGVPDRMDNCTTLANANQRDADGDGYGDRCDPDFNNDGVVTAADYLILRARLNRADPLADLNGDGFVTAADYLILRGWLNRPPGPSGVRN
jgi:hypothetical protein